MLDNRLQKKGLPHPLLQKPFVVSVSNFFIVSVETTDTICPIRKTSSLWYRLLPTDRKNLFLEIKKSTTQIRARQAQIQALSEEEAAVHHAERWEAVVAVEWKKSSLSRKVAAVVDIP
jgi:hypothetical protein